MNLYQNEKLLEAFDLYAQKQDALLPTEEELSAVTLSPAFHAKMQHLLTLRKRGYYVLFGTAGRRVASVLVALLLALTTATVSVKAWRESVLNFFFRTFDTHMEVSFTEDIAVAAELPAETFVPRMPTVLPVGYTMQSDIIEGHHREIIFVDSNGQDCIYYDQNEKYTQVQVDTEDGAYQKITINGYEGMLIHRKEEIAVIFADDKYTYMLRSNRSVEELLAVAKSIQ